MNNEYIRIMKNIIINSVLVALAFLFPFSLFSQNVGIGLLSPAGKLHIKGAADAAQLIIDANTTQSNTNPLIKLRNSIGDELMWIHSDHLSNSFFGYYAGRLNNSGGGGLNN